MLKIHILFKFEEGPWGGGNQFLKALRKYFIEQKVYVEDIHHANAIIINSYPFGSEYIFDQIFKCKKKNPNLIIIHRVDGPISCIRGSGKEIDSDIYQLNNLFADGTIFQSKWSRDKNYELNMEKLAHEQIIGNAPDSKIFNKNKLNKNGLNNEKVKLVATSWSSNLRKGFEIYKFLDEKLDFEKFEMTFVGNSPITFQNINWIKPVPSKELAKILKNHDIFITASKNDPCSNSLIEALSCGLPAVGLNDGGHPEIIGKGGECFNSKKDLIEKIEKISSHYECYQSKIPKFTIDEIGNNYYVFIKEIDKKIKKGEYEPKYLDFSTRLRFYQMKLKIICRNPTNIIGSYLKH